MRRASPVDAMLLGAVLLWALNVTISKYLLTHGWSPLSYGTIRYLAAILLFWIFTYVRERTFRIAREDVKHVLLAAALIFLNQICFVYSLQTGQASTLALLFGTTPVFVALLGLALRHARLQRSFWAGALLTFVGVALIGVDAGGASSNAKGILLGLATAFTWGAYTIAVAPLLRRYSPYRISALVLGLGWIPLAAISYPQVSAQEFSFGWKVWLGFGYAVIGPLFLTTIIWFIAVDRVGAARASLFNNIQPFFAVLFAVLILSEKLRTFEVAGGLLIFSGIALERWRRRPLPDVASGRGYSPEADIGETGGP